MRANPQLPTGISRRALIFGGFAGGALLAVGGLATRLRGPEQYRLGLKAISPREAKTLEIIGLAYFPEGNAIGVSGKDANIAAYIDSYIEALGSVEQKMIRAMLLAFDQGTLLSRRWKPLHRMNQVEAETYLADWEQSSIQIRRDISTGLKSLLGFAYFAHPTVLKNLGITRQCVSAGPSFVVPANA